MTGPHLPPLDPDEFAAVFAAIHGTPPFPWQRDLARRLAETGAWPDALALPTGSGKTAAIDAALFHLALEADRKHERRAPVRIAFVVDRRLIVDEAHERTKRIAQALEDALKSGTGGGPVARMAARLKHLSGDGPPLMACRLRGGLPREDDWARTPSQPTVLCSTIDQVGSRLLFRGYGLSNRMKPIHAGLLGSDCLILLDEAHLAVPFRQTLKAVAVRGAAEGEGAAIRRWPVVGLSATPYGTDIDRLELRPEDRADERLAKRLRAAKPAALRRLDLSAKDQPEEHAEAFAKAAWELLERLSADRTPRPVAVVVNRVALARRVFDALSARINDEGEKVKAQAVLLTGRIRDLDRKRLIDGYGSRLRSNGGEEGPPLIVVATQTIEAGADFDFDGLVTQAAPLDSLRQRFGRLNRMGRPGTAPALILAARDETAAKADDPVYGDRTRRTWEWLTANAEMPEAAPTGGKRKAKAGDPLIDFGIDALDARIGAAGADLSALSAEKPDAPLLRRADVELLSWTAPIPAIDPELAPFLHGPQAGPADVQIVWRADLSTSGAESAKTESAKALLALVPPHAGETLAVPLWAVKAWLSGGIATAVSDVEGASDPSEAEARPSNRRASNRRALRWAGAEEDRTGFVWPNELRPGDVIVVPADYGGCDPFGWNPGGKDAVKDLGDERPETQRRVRRMHPALPESLGHGAQSALSALLDAGDRTDADRIAALREHGFIGRDEDWSEVHRPDGYAGLVLLGPKAGKRPAAPATEDDETGTLIGRDVSLADHSGHAEAKARAFAEGAGLPPDRADDVALAALLHDEGKADPRFQRWLRGADRLLAVLADGIPLAKSGRRMNAAASAAARRKAGLPDRWRHEVDSVVRAMADPRFQRAHDPELVLWLVGVHHGHGRPLFPHDDPGQAPHRPDFTFQGNDWAQMFERLKARYGLWELARMEAIVRLADHRASEDEERAPS